MRSIRDDARALHERFLSLARRRSLRDPVSASCEELGLTAPQVHALLWLGHDGPLTMGELARRVSVTEKTVTGIVDRLERDGYLRRERDEADRRVVRARATTRGAEVSRVISDGMLERLARLLALLGPADRRALFRILDRIALRLDEPPGPRRREQPPGRAPRPQKVRHPRPSPRGRREDTET
jgi:DNA-binding MarR family transcriptional regulator